MKLDEISACPTLSRLLSGGRKAGFLPFTSLKVNGISNELYLALYISRLSFESRQLRLNVCVSLQMYRQHQDKINLKKKKKKSQPSSMKRFTSAVASILVFDDMEV